MPERPDSDREVLTSLPRSRPVRRSSKRTDRPASDRTARSSEKPVAARRPRTAKAAATPGGPDKPAAAARAARPRAAAKPTAKPAATSEPPRPPKRTIPAAGYAAPDARAGEPGGSPAAELVSTTIQAAAELAQIGMTVGRQTLQSMLDRLPKP